MNDELKLKNNLKEARAEKKLSQTQLAELIGVSRNTISSIETGQFNPTAKLAFILCIALYKKFDELFFFYEKSDWIILYCLVNLRRVHFYHWSIAHLTERHF